MSDGKAFGLKSSRPDNLSPFAREVFDALAKYTAFPWPVMMAQCRRANVDPVSVSPRDLDAVCDFMAEAVGRFTSPEKAAAVRDDLRALSARES